MGVTGLWRLIEPAGKPVPVETLENKVLAVDISIWLHQMVKGYQDAKGAPLPNAHLMGLFQRLCKLLYFRIKPIFVFDGGFPDLKKETIAKRQDNKSKYNTESERIKRELFLLLSKKTAISTLLGKQTSPKKGNNAADTSNNDDLFKLPALPETEKESDSESDDEKDSGAPVLDLHSVDIESEKFKNLPVKEKYDLLVELKETRKMNSWKKLHELPKQSDNFSDFQMQRLLKRRKVQECLEETEKEMGDSGMSLNELESLLNEEGIDTRIENLPTRRIASNESTRFLLINNAKQALAEAKNKKETELNTNKIEEEISINNDNKPQKTDELEDDLQKAIKMSLECVTNSDLNANTSKTDDSWTSLITDSDYSNTDSEEEDGFDQPDMSSAKAYVMQYSDFTHKAIDTIVTSKKKNWCKSKIPKVDQVLEELKHEKSVIVDNVDLMSENESMGNESDCNDIITANQDQNVDHVNTTVNLETAIKDDSFNKTLSSIVLVEDLVDNVITLDSSTEENVKQMEIKSEFDENCHKDIEEKSDSSDDDFEEVPETDNKKINQHVVELTLNVGQALEDDIFADIFEKKEKSETHNIKVDSINNSENIIKNKPSEIVTEHATQEQEDKDKVINKNEEDAITKEKLITINENTDIVAGKSSEKNSNVDSGNNLINSSKEHTSISSEKLNSIVEEVQKEEQDLLQEKGRLDRIGRNITEQMTKEAQELLRIFGIPYIVAPMEAEAQCAFLESVKLTDGTITDDSDIWLFGGKTVYKNFFNHRKHVLQFLSERIENSFNLTREQLVLLALLVGSDYTTGVTGVGPVTALEILASFPFNKKQFLNEASKQARYAKIVSGLQEFKQWVWAGKRTDNTSLKKKLKNVNITDDFPSIRVLQAYLEPNVEKSEDKFTWGQLDITILRDYTKSRFGWSQNKLDEIIKPVLSRMLERKSQKTVHDYFKRKVEFQSLEEQMSKRVKAAVKRMGPEALLDKNSSIEGEETKAKPSRKRKTTKKKMVENENDSLPENNDFPNLIEKAGPSGTKKKKQSEENILIGDHIVKVISQTQEDQAGVEINIPKSDRFQEIIPQREKDKQDILQNKLKAIEIFRKTKIDRKRKPFKKTAILPKEKAELSESSDSN